VLLTLFCAFTMLATMLPGIGVPIVTRAQDSATLVLLPDSIAPGGDLRVSGYNFPPGGTFDIYIYLGTEIDVMLVPLGQVQSDARGTVAPTTLPLPSMIAPGDYMVVALLDRPPVVKLTVRPALTLTLSPTAGPPGTVVNVTVINLVPGSLRVDYAGTAVLGPLAVSSGSFSGSFVVPSDRPDPLGEATTVQAVNLVGGLAVGRAEASFQSQAGSLQPRYQVTGLQLPTSAVAAGSRFTIRGQITPAPQGPLSQYQVLPIWKTAGGKSFPIGVGPAQIRAGGSFEVLAKLPSLKNGDPAPAKTGDQVGVVLVAPGMRAQPIVQAGPTPPSGVTLDLEVIDQDTLKTIEGAKVDAMRTDEPLQGGLYNHAGAIFAGNLNQIAGSMDEAGDYDLTDEEKLQKQIEDSTRLLDNRRPLSVAHGSCSGSACTWSYQQLNDPYGRPIYAERPILTLDGTGKPTLTFRGLGFGPDKNGKLEVYPGDAPGMTFHTGELVQLDVNLSSATVVPEYITQDGAVNWQPTAVFDPQTNSTLAVAVNAPALSGLSQTQLKAARSASTSALAPGLPVVFATTPRLPDFAVASVEPSTRYPRMDQPFSVKVDLHNSGAIWAGSVDPPLKLMATWDGRPGVGAPAGEVALTAPAEGQATSVTLDLTPPPDTLDREHTLVVTVNPGQAVTERSAQNNSQSITLGGLPAPEGLVAAIQRGSPLVFLEWQKPDDPRIAGYRVYRVDQRGERTPAGSSFINGWVDINAALDQHYRYVVTSFTDDGVESAPSAPIDVRTGSRRLFLPLVMR
jgi:hypothetical protein